MPADDTVTNLGASTIAALCSRLVTHPLDTIKTRVQATTSGQQSFGQIAGNLVRTHGLYRGLPVALTLSVPGLSVYLTAYDLSKQVFARTSVVALQDGTVCNHMAAATVAEVSSGLFWTPMEVLKQKQQVQDMARHRLDRCPTATAGAASAGAAAGAAAAPSAATAPSSSFKPIGTLQLAKRIYQHEGLLGFYRGYFITLGVFVPYSIMYFTTYEELKALALQQQRTKYPKSLEDPQHPLPFMSVAACAAVSCAIAASVSNVIDVVKTRWQVSVLSQEQLSVTQIIRRMLKQEGGLRSFTRGMGARVLWMVPGTTISMSIFELLKRR
ncbi:hypothetical protein DFQ26_006134 [Actinomortierella ambigua]|nr:hypothetical protein DFQ26_006134 [Actinomortierella ambigua]